MDKKYNDYGKSYSKVYDLITSHKDYLDEAKNLILLLNPHLKKKNILSIGCGTGNHERIISNRGFKVFGIDNSPNMLKQANLKKKKGICEFGTNFNQALKFFGDSKLSCAVSLFNCVNCLLDEKSLMRFITDIRYHLDEKSCIFFEAWNGEECLANPPQKVTRNYKSDDYNITRVAIPKMFFKKKVVEIKYNIFGYIKKSKINFISKHKIKLHSTETILKVLKKTGFSNIRIFSALPELKQIKKNKFNGNRMLAFYATAN